MSWEMHQLYQQDEEKARSAQHQPNPHPESRAGRPSAGFTERDQERIAVQAHAAAASCPGRRAGLGFGSSTQGSAPTPQAGSTASVADRIRQKLQSGRAEAGSAAADRARRGGQGPSASHQLARVVQNDDELGRPVGRGWVRPELHAAASSEPVAGSKAGAAAASVVAAIDSDTVTSLSAPEYQAFQRQRQRHEEADDDQIPDDPAARRSEIAHHDAIFSATSSEVPTLAQGCSAQAAAGRAPSADPRWEARVPPPRHSGVYTIRHSAGRWPVAAARLQLDCS